MSSIKEKTVSGFKWQIVSQYGQKILSILTSVILARILEPADFGHFAMAFIVIDGLGLFKSLGIDSALIQRKGDIDRAAHTSFMIVPLLGVLLCAVAFLAAPFAAAALHAPILTSVIRMLGLVFIFGCLANTPMAILTRELKFKELAVRDLMAAILYSSTAVLLAWRGFGLWSLVYGYLVKQLSTFILVWTMCPYRPRFVFDSRIASELIHFGKYVFGTLLMLFLIEQIDVTLVGRLLGAAMLGFYAMARNTANLVGSHVIVILTRVLYPVYARLQGDKAEIKRICLKVVKTMTIFSFPFAAGMAILTKELVEVVYGNKWLAVVPLLKIFAVKVAAVSLTAGFDPIFGACGKPRWSFWLRFMEVVLMTVLLPTLISAYGIEGAVGAVVLSTLCVVPVKLTLIDRLIGFSLGELVNAVQPSLIGTLVVSAFILAAKSLMAISARNLQDALLLAGLLAAAGGIYFVLLYFLDRKAVREIKNLALGIR